MSVVQKNGIRMKSSSDIPLQSSLWGLFCRTPLGVIFLLYCVTNLPGFSYMLMCVTSYLSINLAYQYLFLLFHYPPCLPRSSDVIDEGSLMSKIPRSLVLIRMWKVIVLLCEVLLCCVKGEGDEQCSLNDLTLTTSTAKSKCTESPKTLSVARPKNAPNISSSHSRNLAGILRKTLWYISYFFQLKLH